MSQIAIERRKFLVRSHEDTKVNFSENKLSLVQLSRFLEPLPCQRIELTAAGAALRTFTMNTQE
jgi:hypothetical protein